MIDPEQEEAVVREENERVRSANEQYERKIRLCLRTMIGDRYLSKEDMELLGFKGWPGICLNDSGEIVDQVRARIVNFIYDWGS